MLGTNQHKKMAFDFQNESETSSITKFYFLIGILINVVVHFEYATLNRDLLTDLGLMSRFGTSPKIWRL
jgi:hypothetical protein